MSENINSQTPERGNAACTTHISNHLHLERVRLEDLRSATRETRKHSPEQLKKIARSIEEFGFITPLLIDANGEIIAGHARVLAAQMAGLVRAPAVRVEHLSPAQIRAFRIAENRLAEDAEWNREALRIECMEILELGIDLELTGFEVPEIDIILGDDPSADEGGAIPAPADCNVVSRLGDIWQLGLHKIVCGDALIQETYDALMGQGLADAVFSDPPYNVPVDRHVCGLGKVQHREFVMASGEMSEEEFSVFLRTFMQALHSRLKPGGIAYACMDWRHIETLLAAGRTAQLELLNFCVWGKTNGGMGSFYRSQHELVPVFKKPGARHLNNVQLGKHGRYRTNLWEYPGISSLGASRDEELAMHPTVKPVDLVTDAIKDCTKRGEIVLDPFGGSGTTLMAAEKTGRVGRLIELDPGYVDVTIQRFAKSFDIEATLLGSGACFTQVKSERQEETTNE